MWNDTMSLRTSLRDTRWLTLGVIALLVWTIVAWFDIVGQLDWAATGYVGQAAVSGAVGLIVMAAALGFLVALFGELGADEPAPESWPPE